MPCSRAMSRPRPSSPRLSSRQPRWPTADPLRQDRARRLPCRRVGGATVKQEGEPAVARPHRPAEADREAPEALDPTAPRSSPPSLRSRSETTTALAASQGRARGHPPIRHRDHRDASAPPAPSSLRRAHRHQLGAPTGGSATQRTTPLATIAATAVEHPGAPAAQLLLPPSRAQAARTGGAEPLIHRDRQELTPAAIASSLPEGASHSSS